MKKRKGNCYAAAEALYHILGGKRAGLTPMVVKLPNGGTHWYLRTIAWEIIDPSRKQFVGKLDFDYYRGRGCGFLTKKPSKRARKLIKALTWREK